MHYLPYSAYLCSLKEMTMRLSELKTGEKGVIVKILGHGSFRRRMMEMGFIKGKSVEVVLNAPLHDPVKYKNGNKQVEIKNSNNENR